MTVKSNLPAVVVAMEGKLRAKNEAAAIVVENAAKGKAPVDTGRLRSSITHDSDDSGFVVGTNVEYAPYVELGTRFMAPEPYLVPGLRDSVGEIEGVYRA